MKLRVKILMVICVLLAAGWFVGTSWIISSQAIEMRELGERLENVEIIVHREIIPVRQESTKQYRHPEIAI